MKPVYIISSACVSPQKTFGEQDEFLAADEIISTDQNVLYCVEPDFKKYINPVQIRRMSRALKIGFSAAMECLQQAGPLQIDAIIAGTGKGCLVDTEAFLHSIKTYNETALNPTHFIHSTYNQLNGMIALNKKINSYNITYAHRGFSFEHCLTDASLLFDEGEANHILVGSFDEMTREHLAVKQTWGYWKKESIESRDLLLSQTSGTIAGEGSSFYVLSNQQTAKDQVHIRSVRTLYNPDAEDIRRTVYALLDEHQLTYDDIDILMSGENGNCDQQHHQALLGGIFNESCMLYFKHLCGEFDTASQFGFWLGSRILSKQVIPEILYHPADNTRFRRDKIRYILLYNNYFALNQSMILLSI